MDKIDTKAQALAKENIIEALIEWMEQAERAGQSPAPVHFSMIIWDDVTLRDALDIARGRK